MCWSQRASTQQHKKILVSGTIGAFQLEKKKNTQNSLHIPLPQESHISGARHFQALVGVSRRGLRQASCHSVEVHHRPARTVFASTHIIVRPTTARGSTLRKTSISGMRLSSATSSPIATQHCARVVHAAPEQ